MTTTLRTTSTTPAAVSERPLAARLAVLTFGSIVYLVFLGTFLYMIGFVAGAFVPKHVDSGAAAPLAEALLVNGAFLGLFAVQHAVMARPAFKRRWTRFVSPAIERSIFVLAASGILVAMIWQWRALPQVVWHVEGVFAPVLWAASAVGWGTVLLATFLIDHFELFGLRQVVRYFRGLPQDTPRFQERSLYRAVRHPLMTGFLLAFWSTPHMTVGHLVFAALCTGYVLIGTRIEERDLIAAHGEAYLDYKRRVPAFFPRLGGAR